MMAILELRVLMQTLLVLISVFSVVSVHDDEIYTVTVEARSEHLSGVSEPMNGIVGRFTSLLCH